MALDRTCLCLYASAQAAQGRDTNPHKHNAAPQFCPQARATMPMQCDATDALQRLKLHDCRACTCTKRSPCVQSLLWLCQHSVHQPHAGAAPWHMTPSRLQESAPHEKASSFAMELWVPVAPMRIERGSLAVVTVGDYIYASTKRLCSRQTEPERQHSQLPWKYMRTAC